MFKRKVVYTKIEPAVVKEQRRFFKHHVKVPFVKWCAYHGWLDDVLNKHELRLAATKGHLPPDLDIHHMMPLSGSDHCVNSFSNLCILHKKTHQRINKEIFQPQLKGIDKEPYGHMQVIEIPVFNPVDTNGIIEERKKVLDKSKIYGIMLTKERGW